MNEKMRNKFTRVEMPKNLINKEIPINHKELIFYESSEYKLTKNNKLSESFYLEEFKVNRYNKQNHWKNKNQIQTFNRDPNNNKLNVRDVIQNLSMTVESNFSIQNTESFLKLSQNKNSPHENLREETFNQDCDNLQKIIFTENVREELDGIPVFQEILDYKFINKSVKIFSPMDTKAIYKINEKLKIPKEHPLWYIFHKFSKSSFGPVSSQHLEELYNLRHIDASIEVRLIDVFKIKNRGPFAYFTLKEIEKENFLLDSVEGSSLLKYLDELNKYKNSATRVEINLKEAKKIKTAVKIEKNNFKKEEADRIKLNQVPIRKDII